MYRPVDCVCASCLAIDVLQADYRPCVPWVLVDFAILEAYLLARKN